MECLGCGHEDARMRCERCVERRCGEYLDKGRRDAVDAVACVLRALEDEMTTAPKKDKYVSAINALGSAIYRIEQRYGKAAR